MQYSIQVLSWPSVYSLSRSFGNYRCIQHGKATGDPRLYLKALTWPAPSLHHICWKKIPKVQFNWISLSDLIPKIFPVQNFFFFFERRQKLMRLLFLSNATCLNFCLKKPVSLKSSLQRLIRQILIWLHTTLYLTSAHSMLILRQHI